MASACFQNEVRFTSGQARQAIAHEVKRTRMLPGRHGYAEPEAMARQPRLELPGIPQRIVQRGNSRLPCFLHDDDWLRCVSLLRQALIHTGCRMHA